MKYGSISILQDEAVGLLEQLISIPSLSKYEDKTAELLLDYLQSKSIPTHRHKNNIWCTNKFFDTAKPTILLNSHHDTVAPNAGYTRDPYTPEVIEGKLYGLGSTDAGASLVSLLQTFLYFSDLENLKYNVVFAASAEEEISGLNGIGSLFEEEDFKECFADENSFAIVGEPTQLQLAIAEKGLMVLDCIVQGKAGHAARHEGENAIYKAIDAVNKIRALQFEKKSELLGDIKVTVTGIEADNKAHNIIPSVCKFMVDVRVTDAYTHEEIFEILKQEVNAEIIPRSMRLRSSFINPKHAIVRAGMLMGKEVYGSPTTSDQALIPLPSLKCGPGFSGQSHSADEFVALQDLRYGVAFYVELLEKIIKG